MTSDSTAGSRGPGVVVGVILIILGGFFLLDRAFDLDIGRFGWPLFVIVPGVLLLAAGLASRGSEGPGLAIAGGITTTVGVILAVQNATDLWATWAYAWALVGPGGAGLGLILYGLFHGRPELVRDGGRSLALGLGLFAVFGLFFEGFVGLSGEPFLRDSNLLPIVLIGAGVAVLGAALFRGRRV